VVVKQLLCEVHHSCLCGAEVKNEWGYMSTAVFLPDMHRYYFICTLIALDVQFPHMHQSLFLKSINFVLLSHSLYGLGSSAGIATDYRLDGPGIESRWGRDFLPVQTGPEAHTASCTMGTRSFPGVKCCGQGMLLTTHPLLVPRSWKSRAVPLPPSGPQPGL